MKTYDLVIVGGGAGGLFAGALASKNNLKTLIIEKENKLGKKLLATGNGRCNIANTNLYGHCYNNSEFVKQIFEKFANKEKLTNFAKPILVQLEEWGLSFYADSEGRVYPTSNSSACVVSVLSNTLAKFGAEIMLESEVKGIEKVNNIFKLKVNNQNISAKNVLLCCGGSAVNLAKELGHSITPLAKSLVGFKTTQNLKQISGVRVHKAKIFVEFENEILKSSHSPLVEITLNTFAETGEIIFKDNGISGICVMNASAVVARNNNQKFKLHLDLLPDVPCEKIEEKLNNFFVQGAENMLNCLYGWFAKPLAKWLFEKHKTPKQIAKQIKKFALDVCDTYENNQVTCGGVEVNELNLTQSKLVSGLYLSGEMLNIDGVCGGYNLMFALASAGLSVKLIINNIKE